MIPRASRRSLRNNSGRERRSANCSFIYRRLKILAQSARDCFYQPRRIRLRTLLSSLIRDESGVTAIEYALIAALIAVAAIAAFTLVGTNLSTTFSKIANQL
jgi:pilus assembly protein Flp/PilA